MNRIKSAGQVLEHRAQKWEPVLRKKRCDSKNLEQDA
jgi:hypothetical protein